MGRIAVNQRHGLIKRRKKRQQKLAGLRLQLGKATGTAERKSLWEKVEKIAPWLTQPEFLVKLKPVKK